MKLKKIASLMLAGVMAVSMLAGCQNTNVKPDAPTDPDPTPATGYSVDLGNALADVLKEHKIDTVVTFADSDVDKAALEDALGNLGRDQLLATSGSDYLRNLNDVEANADFEDAAKLDRDTLVNGNGEIYDYKYNLNKTVKVGDIFAVDATVDMSKAINWIVAE